MIIHKDSVEVDILASIMYFTDDESEVGITIKEFEEIIKAYQKWKNENPSSLNAPSTEG